MEIKVSDINLLERFQKLLKINLITVIMVYRLSFKERKFVWVAAILQIGMWCFVLSFFCCIIEFWWWKSNGNWFYNNMYDVESSWWRSDCCRVFGDGFHRGTSRWKKNEVLNPATVRRLKAAGLSSLYTIKAIKATGRPL